MPRPLTAVALLCVASLFAACSLGVTKPPARYRTGIVPDCESSYLPPAIDYVAAAGALGTIALDDEVFCPTCPLPYIVAAFFLATAVYGHRRVRKCSGLQGQHAEFIALPREEQDTKVRERRAEEGK